MRHVITLLAALFAASVSIPARAESGEQVLAADVTASILVAVHVHLHADGSVVSVELDKEEEIPVGVVNLVHAASRAWRFAPVKLDAGTDRARARMRLRITARAAPENTVAIAISGASFGLAQKQLDGLRSVRSQLAPPVYPRDLARMGVSRTVYLLLLVDRQGHVAAVESEQVNLRTRGNPMEMAKWRSEFARTSARAGRDWTFPLPPEGNDSYTVRVPIAYLMPDQPQEQLNHWYAYLPGQRTKPDWVPADDTGDAADTVGSGDIALVGSGPRLLTGLNPG